MKKKDSELFFNKFKIFCFFWWCGCVFFFINIIKIGCVYYFEKTNKEVIMSLLF